MQPCWMGVGFLIDIAPMDEIRAGEHPSVWNVVGAAGAGGGTVELDDSSEAAAAEPGVSMMAADELASA